MNEQKKMVYNVSIKVPVDGQLRFVPLGIIEKAEDIVPIIQLFEKFADSGDVQGVFIEYLELEVD